jgi:hypothetical protein
MNGLRNFLSVDEMKISVLVMCFLSNFILIMYYFITKQNVDSGLLDLAKTLIYSIAGVNIGSAVSYGFSSYYGKNNGYSGVSTLGTNQSSVNNTSTNNINNITNIEDRV